MFFIYFIFFTKIFIIQLRSNVNIYCILFTFNYSIIIFLISLSDFFFILGTLNQFHFSRMLKFPIKRLIFACESTHIFKHNIENNANSWIFKKHQNVKTISSIGFDDIVLTFWCFLKYKIRKSYFKLKNKGNLCVYKIYSTRKVYNDNLRFILVYLP